MTPYTGHIEAASIQIGDKGYKFVDIFKNGNFHVAFNGEVELICLDWKRKYWYNNGQFKLCTLA